MLIINPHFFLIAALAAGSAQATITFDSDAGNPGNNCPTSSATADSPMGNATTVRDDGASYAPTSDGSGDIVYVDAAEGSTGNTFATGGALSDTSWIHPDTGTGADDDQWKKRGFGNDGTIFQSIVGTVGLQTGLTTRVTGLPGGGYQVWVFFWDAAGTNQWNISAGLNPGSLVTYSFDGLGDTASPVAASTLSFDPANAPGLTAEGDRILYGVNLGEVAVAGGSAIEVFVNGLAAGSDNRTWYDGIGYKAVGDADGDGLPDAYEQSIIDADPEDGVTSFADVMGTGAAPAVTDFDGDGSNDAEEFANRTDPLDPDSDDDGLLDGVETNTGIYIDANDTGTDPLNDDTDGDGLLDSVETHTNTFVDAGNTGTSPLNPDSDGDGLSDGFEVANNTNPTDRTDPHVPSAGNPIQVAPDGAWTWFNDERAIWHLGILYCGYVTSDGWVGISRFDPATLATSHTLLSSFTQRDDHNNPSITVLPDNRLLVVYSKHSTESIYYRRISTVTQPASIADWGAEITAPAGGAATYANTYRLSAESDRIYLFNRAINFNPTLQISDDNGITFGPPTHFIATGSGGIRPYPKYVSNGTDRIDLIYTDGHPRNQNNSIYHLFYQGGEVMKTDGTVVKAIGDLPILHDSGERGTEVYTYSAAAWGPRDGPDDWIPGARGWTWDMGYGKDGHPVCAFQVQVDNVTGTGDPHDRIYYYYARWTGSEWQRRFIAHGGRGIYSGEDDYGGGMAIDPDNPNTIYISTNAAAPFNLGNLSNVPLTTDDRYEIWQGTTADGGLTFSWLPITVGSANNNLRPIVPENHGYDRSVVWFRGNYTSYTNYNTELVGIFQNQLRILGSQVGPAGGNLTWASSPGKTYRIMGSGDLPGFPHEVAIDIDSQGAETSRSFPIPAPLSGAPRAFFRVEER